MKARDRIDTAIRLFLIILSTALMIVPLYLTILNAFKPNAEIAAGSLSGGNQQKVVVAKWLARESRVVIFDEPTRGIDVAAKVEIYEIINDLKKRGIAVIIVSSEMPEVMGISDRILVMCNGRVTGEVDPRDTSEEAIMTYATQFGDNAE